jgi:hypothetical protein
MPVMPVAMMPVMLMPVAMAPCMPMRAMPFIPDEDEVEDWGVCRSCFLMPCCFGSSLLSPCYRTNGGNCALAFSFDAPSLQSTRLSRRRRLYSTPVRHTSQCRHPPLNRLAPRRNKVCVFPIYSHTYHQYCP